MWEGEMRDKEGQAHSPGLCGDTVHGTNSVCWGFQKVPDSTATLRDGYMDLSQTTPPQQHWGNRRAQRGDVMNMNRETGGTRTLSHLDMLQDILDSCPSHSLLCSTGKADFTSLLPSCSSPTPPHPISCLHQICCPQEPSPSQMW